jgi:hypothetical protein
MNDQVEVVENLIERIEAYTITTLELSRLKALKTAIVFATASVSHVLVIIMFLFSILSLNIGFALYLGEQFGKAYMGFLAVAVLDIVLALIFRLYLQRWIKKPVSDFMISQVL